MFIRDFYGDPVATAEEHYDMLTDPGFRTGIVEPGSLVIHAGPIPYRIDEVGAGAIGFEYYIMATDGRMSESPYQHHRASQWHTASLGIMPEASNQDDLPTLWIASYENARRRRYYAQVGREDNYRMTDLIMFAPREHSPEFDWINVFQSGTRSDEEALNEAKAWAYAAMENARLDPVSHWAFHPDNFRGEFF